MLKKTKEKSEGEKKKVKLFKNPIKPIDTAVISARSRVEGSIETEGTLIVDGSVTGKIKCNSLEIIAEGRVDAEVDAEEVSVAGIFEGRMLCSGRLTIRSTGKVVGDVSYGTLAIEFGGRLDGKLSKHISKETSVLPFYQEESQFQSEL
jgi:cytoskeletal protein CcmA (bactofilin family)